MSIFPNKYTLSIILRTEKSSIENDEDLNKFSPKNTTSFVSSLEHTPESVVISTCGIHSEEETEEGKGSDTDTDIDAASLSHFVFNSEKELRCFIQVINSAYRCRGPNRVSSSTVVDEISVDCVSEDEEETARPASAPKSARRHHHTTSQQPSSCNTLETHHDYTYMIEYMPEWSRIVDEPKPFACPTSSALSLARINNQSVASSGDSDRHQSMKCTPLFDPCISPIEIIKNMILGGKETSSFFLTSLKTVEKQFLQWKAELPMIQPFYAVKCNPNTEILRLLASLNCNFDCATRGEIELLCNGLGPSFNLPKESVQNRIIYAQPCKMADHLTYAVETAGVRMTVFDSLDELHKIANSCSTQMKKDLKLLLRIQTDDSKSVCRLSNKFGASMKDSFKLIDIAVGLGLGLVGIAFHVGSGCGNSAVYGNALSDAKTLFDYASSIGQSMYLVDIGGGFPGHDDNETTGKPSFQEIALQIREGVAAFQADMSPDQASRLQFIAEPGRYFVSSSTYLATKVFSKKSSLLCTTQSELKNAAQTCYQALYVDDGVYGSFNNVVYDHYAPQIHFFVSTSNKKVSVSYHDNNNNNSVHKNKNNKSEQLIPTNIFGPTCDGLDQIRTLDNTYLPSMNEGDWLIFQNMGAYTHTASYIFNGYDHVPNTHFCYHH